MLGLWFRRWVLATGMLAAAGCQKSGGNVASGMLAEPTAAPLTGSQDKCAVRRSYEKPLVVEWPSPDRGSLEARLRVGMVAVRYQGCEMEVLRNCRIADGTYRYSGFTRKDDVVRIGTEDELYANLPIGAARLEAKIRKGETLTVGMTLVGMYEGSRVVVTPADLVGACQGATHVITGVQVGAYEFFAEQGAEVGGGAGIEGGPGVGAKSSARRETLTRDGDAAKCTSSSSSDSRPPDGCGALIRLEVAQLTPSAQPAAGATPPVKAKDTAALPTQAPPTQAQPDKPAKGLTKDEIRKVVRANIEDVRNCYNLGLIRNPKLKGQVKVQFAIAASGAVSGAVVVSSQIKHPQVEACIVKKVKRWRFPNPTGGSTVVTYPFNLTPG